MSNINIKTNRIKLAIVIAGVFILANSIQIFGLSQANVYAEINCDAYDHNTPAYSACIQAQQAVDNTGSSSGCNSRFLGFPTWYRGLTNADCSIKSPENGTVGLSNFIWHIVLNVVEIAVMLVGYLSVIFIIYGGVLYITSAGSADGVKKAKASITNAIIGLVISIVAVAIVEFIFNQLLAGVS